MPDHATNLHSLMQRSKATNLAQEMDQTDLSKLGAKVCLQTKIDEDSRAAWKKRTEAGLQLALQEKPAKSFPWPSAANIQYPLMTTAAIQFAARAYPAVVAGNDVVKAQVTGADPGGAKRARADRIAAHMSWQCLNEMPEWEPEVDRMLHSLPIVGNAFKKTYFDTTLGRNRSDRVDAFDFIVNTAASDIKTAPRVTQQFTLYPYQIQERIRSELFTEFTYGTAIPTEKSPGGTKAGSDGSDEDAPHTFYEQHRREDLDGDGYPEPIIVTVHKDTEKVCRITANYDEDGIIIDRASGQVMAIESRDYFTKVPFIPNPEGGFYDVGFAWLLSPLNRAIDTLINQLLDAGTLANTGGGFIGSQLRLKGGTLRFAPGEYKEIDVPGGVAKDNIVSLTFPGPSDVLFKLLGLLIESGKEVASVKDIMTGEAPPANTPATTTLALIEQGLKVFTAIYKRIHRALKEEFAKLYKLNQKYLDGTRYAEFTDAPEVSLNDYQGDPIDIVPVSDPAMVSDMQKLARAEFLERFKAQPGMDMMAITLRQLDAAGIPNAQELFAKQTGPSPEELAKFAELEAQVDQMKAAAEASRAAAYKAISEAMQLEPAAQLERIRLWLDSMEVHADATAPVSGGEGKSSVRPKLKPALVPFPSGVIPPSGKAQTSMSKRAGIIPQ